MYKQKNEQDKSEYDQLFSSVKTLFSQVLFGLLAENQLIYDVVFEFLVLIESLQLFWLVWNPELNIFPDKTFLLAQLQQVLAVVNFQQYARDSPSLYQMLLIIVFVYLLLLYLAIAYYAILVVRRIDGNTQMLVKKAANFAIILTCRILTLPFIGLGMMFPCNSTPNDPACTGMNAAILGACGIIITVLTVTLNIGFSICYYIKYPLAKCWMAREDNYDELGKLLLKLGGPIYFFIDPVLQYKFLYFLGLMALQAASLFFFRMFTLNNYIRRNEQFRFAMDFFLLFQSLNAFAMMKLSAMWPLDHTYSIVFSLCCAGLLSAAAVIMKRADEMRMLKQFLKPNFKKTQMKTVYFILMDKLMQSNGSDQILINAVSKIIRHRITNCKSQIRPAPTSKQCLFTKQGAQLLSELVEWMLEQSPNPMLKAMRCFMMVSQQKVASGIHDSIELSEEKLDFSHEFMMFYFRNKENVFQKLPETEGISDQLEDSFRTWFIANEKSLLFESLLEQCTSNSIQYWDELHEAEPSMHKILNLARMHSDYVSQASSLYSEIVNLSSSSMYASNLYLLFLSSVVQDHKESEKVREKLSIIMEKILKERQERVNGAIDQQVSKIVMTIDTISERLGWIRNCNSEIKNLLLYDKRELIGKHINLIMPRVFGLEHDRLLTEYIINKNDQASTEKPVFPISKDNTFCQMTLHIKILSNNSHSLYLVGIMQPNYDIRMPSIMIDIKSLRIEGVNNDFVKFLRFKIDAKVFFSESVLAGSLLPEFSIDKFLEEKKVISYVDAAYSTNAERYECDDNSEELPSLQKRMLICLEKQITVGPVTLALASLKESGDSGEFRSQRTKIRSQMTLNSNMDTFYNILPSSKQVEKRKTANVDRMKMSDFVEDSCKKISTVKVMSNVGLGLFLVLAVGCCYLQINRFFMFSMETSGVYSQIGKGFDMLVNEGAINLVASQIGHQDTSTMSHPQLTKLLSDNLKQLQENYYQMVTEAKKQTCNLTFNSNHSLPFTVLLDNNLETFTFDALDGLNHYIISASNILYHQEYPVNSSVIHGNYIFITRNGRVTIPSQVLYCIKQYLQLRKDNYSHYVFGQYLISLGYSLLCLLLFLVVLYLAFLTRKLNSVVISLYNLVPLMDVNTISGLCTEYYVRINKWQCNDTKSHQNYTQHTLSDNTHPNIHLKTNDKPNIHLNTHNKPSIHNKLNTHNKPNIHNKLNTHNKPNTKHKQITTKSRKHFKNVQFQYIPTHSQHQDGKLDDEHASLQSRTKNVNLPYHDTLRRNKFWATPFIVLVLFSFLYSLFRMNFGVQLGTCFDNLQEIGQIRKNLKFVSFYSYQTLSFDDQEVSLKLLSNQIAAFYNNIALSYSLFDPKSAILLSVYSQMEEIKKLIFRDGGTSPSYQPMSQIYKSLFQQFLAAQTTITNMTNTVYTPVFNGTLTQEQNNLLARIIVDLIGCLLLCVALKIFLLAPICKQSQNQISMIKLLPVWVIAQNEDMKLKLTCRE